MHFEVYESLDAATQGGAKLRTSQLAIRRRPARRSTRPGATSRAWPTWRSSSLEGDMVFADGYASQLAKASGSVQDGYTLTLNVGV